MASLSDSGTCHITQGQDPLKFSLGMEILVLTLPKGDGPDEGWAGLLDCC